MGTVDDGDRDRRGVVTDAWMVDAECRGCDPDVFFLEVGASARYPKSICAVCVVRDECRSKAIQDKERLGIWGGLTPKERRRLRKGHPWVEIHCLKCGINHVAKNASEPGCSDCKRWFASNARKAA